MRTAKLAPVVAAMRGVLLFAVCASVAGAQNLDWILQFGATQGEAVALAAAPDGTGGVFVAGETNGNLGGPNAGQDDAWFARYDSAGTRTWVRQLGTPVRDQAHAVAPDGAGGVFVAGDTSGSLGGPNSGSIDAWVARYDSAGNWYWIRQFGAGGGNYARTVAPDGAGGVFVAGETTGNLGGVHAGGNYDAWVAHYDAAGTRTWIRQLGTTSDDYAYAAAPDGAGGVFVSGRTKGSLGGPNVGNANDAWVAHYDAAGNQTWVEQLGSTSSEYAYAAAPDGAGGVFVAGHTGGSLGGPTAGGDDAWVAHYDAAGNQTWVEQFGSASADNLRAAAPDGAGGVFLTGETGGSLGGPNAGQNDVWFARYDGAGSQTWIRQLGTGTYDNAYAAAYDGGRGVFLGGRTSGSLGGPSTGQRDAWVAHYDWNAPYCSPAVPNSTGQPGQMSVTGSPDAANNDLTLVASQLSLDSFGFFITSQTQGFGVGAGGSQGNICLSGDIGRFVGPGQILNSGAAGTFSLAVDLTLIPQPFLSVAVQPGQTWNFQAWHRDANPSITSNFTDAVAVTFQ